MRLECFAWNSRRSPFYLGKRPVLRSHCRVGVGSRLGVGVDMFGFLALRIMNRMSGCIRYRDRRKYCVIFSNVRIYGSVDLAYPPKTCM